MIIAVDAAGGDYAPHEIVKGAIKAAQEFDVEIALVGRKNILRVMLDKDKAARKSNVSIVEASQVIDFDEHPMRAVKSKPNSSIVVGVNLVKNGEAAAFVSAGSTGAVFCAAMLSLGAAPGVERPAIGCFLDALSSYPALLVDAGANVECRPTHLLEFARLGTAYSRSLLGIKSPTVGLLSNGTEATKGNKLVQEVHELLKEAPDINFFGNIEGHDIARRTVDVIVTDGFTGNVVIKTIEGLNDNFLAAARQIGHIFSNISQHRGRDLLRDIGLGSLTKRMDYTEFGGAGLLGINGNVIIAHGRSQAKAIRSAIALAKETAEHTTPQTLKGEEK